LEEVPDIVGRKAGLGDRKSAMERCTKNIFISFCFRVPCPIPGGPTDKKTGGLAPSFEGLVKGEEKKKHKKSVSVRRL